MMFPFTPRHPSTPLLMALMLSLASTESHAGLLRFVISKAAPQSSSSSYSAGRPSHYRPSTSATPPATAGEYRIYDSKGGLGYVGETNNLNRRLGEHERSGKLCSDCSVTYQQAKPDSTSASRREHERQTIEALSPPWNKSRGGEGRPAAQP